MTLARVLALVLALTGPAAAAVGDPALLLPDPAQEERAREIGRELRCMVCQNQSIEDSDAELARDLRRIVREQVSSGRSDAEVKGFVFARYGDFVLLRPRFTAATAALWLTPAVALLAGGLLLRGARRRSGMPASPGALTEAERARLARLESGGGDGSAA